MPRKSLTNRKKEIAVQKEIERNRKKERAVQKEIEKKRKENEFIASQLARGRHVRNMLWKEDGEEEVTELLVVYKVKEGYADPFDKDHIVYKMDNGQVIEREKVKRVDMRTAVEQMSKMNFKD